MGAEQFISTNFSFKTELEAEFQFDMNESRILYQKRVNPEICYRTANHTWAWEQQSLPAGACKPAERFAQNYVVERYPSNSSKQ